MRRTSSANSQLHLAASKYEAMDVLLVETYDSDYYMDSDQDATSTCGSERSDADAEKECLDELERSLYSLVDLDLQNVCQGQHPWSTKSMPVERLHQATAEQQVTAEIIRRMSLSSTKSIISELFDAEDDSNSDDEKEFGMDDVDDHLESVLQGISTVSPSWEAYFVPITQERKDSYTAAISKAARKSNLSALREALDSGACLDGCNNQGETLLHLACRRGDLALVQFLMEEARVPVNVRDEYGKTPMHDLAWSPNPNFQVAQVLLEAAPELILAADQRGFTAFQYAPRQTREAWTDFLSDNREKLRLSFQYLAFRQTRDELRGNTERLQAMIIKYLDVRSNGTTENDQHSLPTEGTNV